tara:strand:- start:729 stop:3134 length:2406 start_codon:yes stop_codon:yes gene_type:complete
VQRKKKFCADLKVASAIFATLLFSFWPYGFFEFGFHNDFSIWEYDNSRCCTYFVESSHLINIGRFLQSYLQNIYLMFFDSVPSFTSGRILSLFTSGICAYLIFLIGLRNSLSRLESLVFGVGIFLLPASQINNGWVANYIPGVFNVLIVSCCIFLTPSYPGLVGREVREIIKLLACLGLLLCCLYIYPPTAGFFLLPIFMRMLFGKTYGRKELGESIFSMVVFGAACVFYFVGHKSYTIYKSIQFPHGSLYDFDVSGNLFGNFLQFSVEIFPALLNLFSPTSTWLIAGCSLVIIFLGTRGPIAQARPLGPFWVGSKLNYISSIGILVVAYGFVNAPGLLAAGSPPEFFRAWHPGASVLLLFFMAGIRGLFGCRWQKVVLVTSLLSGALICLNGSFYLASVLSEQFESAKRQFAGQFHPERSTYLIVEKRPTSEFMGFPRWGEMGFVHILSRGHGIHILATEHSHNVHPIIESVVANPNSINLIIESEVSGFRPSKMVIPGVIPRNGSVLPAIDSNIRSILTLQSSDPVVIVEVERSRKLACYNIVLPKRYDAEAVPIMGWKLYGGHQEAEWHLLDKRVIGDNARDPLEDVFATSAHDQSFKFYKFVFSPRASKIEFGLAELELFEEGGKCSQGSNPEVGVASNKLERLLAAIGGSNDPKIRGAVTTSSVSNPAFRLQRAFDSIYYTFWETALVDPVEILLQPSIADTLHCYQYSAGNDMAHPRMPKHWMVWGRLSDGDWNLIDQRNDPVPWRDNEKRTYKIAEPKAFDEYKFTIESNYGDEYLRIYDIKFAFNSSCSVLIP